MARSLQQEDRCSPTYCPVWSRPVRTTDTGSPSSLESRTLLLLGQQPGTLGQSSEWPRCFISRRCSGSLRRQCYFRRDNFQRQCRSCPTSTDGVQVCRIGGKPVLEIP